MEQQVTDAGFRVIVRAGRPANPDEQPQGYLVAQLLRIQSPTFTTDDARSSAWAVSSWPVVHPLSVTWFGVGA